MASLSPELITELGNFPITNTILATIVVDAILILLLILIAKNLRLTPGKLQNAFESVISYFYDLTKSMTGRHTMAIFPWVMTFFLFILVSNFLGLMPGIGSIGINPPTHTTDEVSAPHKEDASKVTPYEDNTQIPNTTPHEDTSHAPAEDTHTEIVQENHNEKAAETQSPTQVEQSTVAKEEHTAPHLVSLLRPATSDFNATLALAAISLVVTHILSIRYTGLKNYLSRYFVLNPIMLFIGLLELVSEFTKVISLSFRLFGNIYAGEVVLATISGLFAFLAPLPFLLLESIVAIIQALVFAMLTLVFMSLMTKKHHGEEH